MSDDGSFGVEGLTRPVWEEDGFPGVRELVEVLVGEDKGKCEGRARSVLLLEFAGVADNTALLPLLMAASVAVEKSSVFS